MTIILCIYGFVFFAIMAALCFDRWLPLVSDIIFGNKTHLKDDILDSGLCEGKLDDPPRWKARRPVRDPDVAKLAEELFRDIS